MRDSLEAAAYGYAAIEERKRNMKARGLVRAEMAEQTALEEENFALAANQCDGGYGDEYGNHQCRRVDRAVKEAEHLAGEANRWMDENRRLREALKPFADFCERYFNPTWQDHESHWTNFDGLTVEDFRRARAALAAESASGEESKDKP